MTTNSEYSSYGSYSNNPIEKLAWQDEALCAQTDPEAFFPTIGSKSREAKKVCGHCEVGLHCLHYGLKNKSSDDDGIFGGMSLKERQKLIDKSQDEIARAYEAADAINKKR